MLKLNSQYAKSFMRETAPEQKRSPNLNIQPRLYEPTRRDQKSKNRLEDQYRPEKDKGKYEPDANIENQYTFSGEEKRFRQNRECRERQTSQCRDFIPNYGPSYKDLAANRGNQASKTNTDCIKNTRRYEQFNNDFENVQKSPRNYIPKRNTNTVIENYSRDERIAPEGPSQSYGGYNRYIEKPTQLDYRYNNPINPANDKRDYLAKHSRRNEQVKSRILKQQQNYTPRDSYDRGRNNYLPQNQEDRFEQPNGNSPYQNYQEEQGISQRQEYNNLYKNCRKNYGEEDNRKHQVVNRRNNYQALTPQFSQQMSQRRGDQYGHSDRFEKIAGNERSNIVQRASFNERPSLNDRKQIIKKSIENTPQRNFKGCKYEPGSSERKQSLIQKSQMLQQKLKKLSIQYPNESKNNQNSRQNQYNYDGVQRIIGSRSTTPISNRSASQMRTSFKNVNIAPVQEHQRNIVQKNLDFGRQTNITGVQQKQGLNNRSSEALDKITKLNEKINERIQSIISNYAKK